MRKPNGARFSLFRVFIALVSSCSHVGAVQHTHNRATSNRTTSPEQSDQRGAKKGERRSQDRRESGGGGETGGEDSRSLEIYQSESV